MTMLLDAMRVDASKERFTQVWNASGDRVHPRGSPVGINSADSRAYGSPSVDDRDLPCTHRHFMTVNDMPHDLKLEGDGTGDVPDLMARFHISFHLVAVEGTGEDQIDRRVVRFLPLLLCGTARTSYNHLIRGTLEWRSARRLVQLRQINPSVTAAPPQPWSDWGTSTH